MRWVDGRIEPSRIGPLGSDRIAALAMPPSRSAHLFMSDFMGRFPEPRSR